MFNARVAALSNHSNTINVATNSAPAENFYNIVTVYQNGSEVKRSESRVYSRGFVLSQSRHRLADPDTLDLSQFPVEKISSHFVWANKDKSEKSGNTAPYDPKIVVYTARQNAEMETYRRENPSDANLIKPPPHNTSSNDLKNVSAKDLIKQDTYSTFHAEDGNHYAYFLEDQKLLNKEYPQFMDAEHYVELK